MNISIIKVKGYSCPSKWLLTVDENPIVFGNSEMRLKKLSAFIQGFVSDEEIEDKKILKTLIPIKLEWKLSQRS